MVTPPSVTRDSVTVRVSGTSGLSRRCDGCRVLLTVQDGGVARQGREDCTPRVHHHPRYTTWVLLPAPRDSPGPVVSFLRILSSRGEPRLSFLRIPPTREEEKRRNPGYSTPARRRRKEESWLFYTCGKSEEGGILGYSPPAESQKEEESLVIHHPRRAVIRRNPWLFTTRGTRRTWVDRPPAGQKVTKWSFWLPFAAR